MLVVVFFVHIYATYSDQNSGHGGRPCVKEVANGGSNKL